MSLRERCVQDLVLALSTHVHNKVATVTCFLRSIHTFSTNFIFAGYRSRLRFRFVFIFVIIPIILESKMYAKKETYSKIFIIEDDNELLN